MSDYIPISERCLSCAGAGQYWTRRRDGEKEWHDCADCKGTGRIAPEPDPVEEPLPVTTTKAEPLPTES